MKLGMLGAFETGSSMGEMPRLLTPSEIEGPFYPVVDQQDKDSDLTKIDGYNGVAEGRHIIIRGQITDIAGHPVKNTTIDIWQANTHGRYRHPNDPNPAPLDPNFQGWAIIASKKDGIFRFKTIMPGSYPASETWTRPPHIHFKVSRQGYSSLTTQMYFPEERLNETDLLMRNKRALEQSLMIAKAIGKEENLEVYEYNIVLEEI